MENNDNVELLYDWESKARQINWRKVKKGFSSDSKFGKFFVHRAGKENNKWVLTCPDKIYPGKKEMKYETKEMAMRIAEIILAERTNDWIILKNKTQGEKL